jgi:hypothetical protein
MIPATKLVGWCREGRLTAIDGAWLPEVSERWLVKEGIAVNRLSRECKK